MNLQVEDLPSRQFSALQRKAQGLGLTPGSYVRQLIEQDLAMDAKAQSTPLVELAAPFRKAFANVSDEEMDRFVDAARGKLRRKGGNQKK